MIEKFERILLDEWIYIPLTALLLLWAFGLGLLVGWIWTVLL